MLSRVMSILFNFPDPAPKQIEMYDEENRHFLEGDEQLDPWLSGYY